MEKKYLRSFSPNQPFRLIRRPVRQTFIPALIRLALSCFCLAIGLAACDSSQNTKPRTYPYPTQLERDVKYYCSHIYDAKYALRMGNARKQRVRGVMSVDNTLVAFFHRHDPVIIPVNTDLPQGEEFYCYLGQPHYPCHDGKNQDTMCLRKTRNRHLDVE